MKTRKHEFDTPVEQAQQYDAPIVTETKCRIKESYGTTRGAAALRGRVISSRLQAFVMEGLEDELLNPLVDRTFAIAPRDGMLPEPPMKKGYPLAPLNQETGDRPRGWFPGLAHFKYQPGELVRRNKVKGLKAAVGIEFFSITGAEGVETTLRDEAMLKRDRTTVALPVKEQGGYVNPEAAAARKNWFERDIAKKKALNLARIAFREEREQDGCEVSAALAFNNTTGFTGMAHVDALRGAL